MNVLQTDKDFGAEFNDLIYDFENVTIKYYGTGLISMERNDDNNKVILKKDKLRYIQEFESHINSLKRLNVSGNSDMDTQIFSYLTTKELSKLELCHPKFKYIIKPRISTLKIQDEMTGPHRRWLQSVLKLNGTPIRSINIKLPEKLSFDFFINKSRFKHLRHIDIDSEVSTEFLSNIIEKADVIETVKLTKIRGSSLASIAKEYHRLNGKPLRIVTLFCSADLRPIKREIASHRLIIQNINVIEDSVNSKSVITGM